MTKKIKISAERIQNSAEKIQNSAANIQKITIRVTWIFSKQVCDVISRFIALTKIKHSWAIAQLLVTRFNPYLHSSR